MHHECGQTHVCTMNVDIKAHVLPFLDDTRPLLAALSPKRAKNITSGDWRHGYVMVNGVRLEGLTPLLERVCWSGRRPGHMPQPSDSCRRRRRLRRLQATTPMQQLTGAKRGTLVHRQIMELITMDVSTFQRRNVHGAHPWACRIVDAVLARNWIPVAADLSAYVEEWKMATEIDLLCVHIPTGDLVCVEVKTGYSDGVWTHTDGRRMRGYLSSVLPDAPYYRALIQSLVGMALFVHGHNVPGRVGAAVMRIDDDHLEIALVDTQFALQHSVPLVAELAKAATATPTAPATTKTTKHKGGAPPPPPPPAKRRRRK